MWFPAAIWRGGGGVVRCIANCVFMSARFFLIIASDAVIPSCGLILIVCWKSDSTRDGCLSAARGSCVHGGVSTVYMHAQRVGRGSVDSSGRCVLVFQGLFFLLCL